MKRYNIVLMAFLFLCFFAKGNIRQSKLISYITKEDC